MSISEYADFTPLIFARMELEWGNYMTRFREEEQRIEHERYLERRRAKAVRKDQQRQMEQQGFVNIERCMPMAVELPTKAREELGELGATPKAESGFETYTRISQQNQTKKIKATKAAAKKMVKAKQLKKMSSYFPRK
jgi:hypothetical protein